MINNLAAQFDAAMWATYEEGKNRGYYPTYFVQMLNEHGGVETAKRLLTEKEAQSGLYRLWELHILVQSMEAHVILDKFQPLFTEKELQEARRRLDELNYFEDYP
jgi:hypothetical protein